MGEKAEEVSSATTTKVDLSKEEPVDLLGKEDDAAKPSPLAPRQARKSFVTTLAEIRREYFRWKPVPWWAMLIVMIMIFQRIRFLYLVCPSFFLSV